MSLSLRRGASLLVLVLAQAAFAAPAHAQLGGMLKKKAKEAAKSAVEDQIPFTPKEAPEFNDRVLEISVAHLDGMLKGFEAEVAYRKEASKEADALEKKYKEDQKAYDAAMEAYNEATPTWDACSTEFRRKEVLSAEKNEDRIAKAYADMNEEELEKYVEDLATRGEALTRKLQAGASDPATQKEWDDYQREVQVLALEQQRRAMLAMSGGMAEARRAATEDPRLVEACGKKPVQPEAPTDPSLNPESVLIAKGAAAAGLTAAQYSIMRERLIYWSEQDGRPAGMGYTQAEIDILAERADDVNGAIDKMKKAKVPL